MLATCGDTPVCCCTTAEAKPGSTWPVLKPTLNPKPLLGGLFDVGLKTHAMVVN
jgi:hypothetical protein